MRDDPRVGGSAKPLPSRFPPGVAWSVAVGPGLQIFDETLRDGEQQAGLCYPDDVKLELAVLIARTGVHAIDSMPAVDEAEAALVRRLATEDVGEKMSCATPLGRRHIELAKACGAARVILFHAVSDRLMYLRDPVVRADAVLSHRTVDDGGSLAVVAAVRERAAERIAESVAHARALGFHVDFAAEDASRADPGFLVSLIARVAPELGHFMLCDTVGVLTPERTSAWIEDILMRTGGARLAVHFHNDMGLALENTVRAVLAGATMVSGTFRGVGERAGNVAIEQVIDALAARHGIEFEGIDRRAVGDVLAYMDERGYEPAPPYSEAARRHASGIHVHSLLLDRKSYAVFDDREPEIWFGKIAGASNVRYLFERRLGRSLPQREYERLSSAIKRKARAEQRAFSADDVLAMLDNGELGF